MPRLCSDSSRPYPGRSVSRAMRSALRKIPERTTGKSRSRHIRMLSPGVSEPSIARKQRFFSLIKGVKTIMSFVNDIQWLSRKKGVKIGLKA